MNAIMGLTMWQPWAWAIAAGLKDLENRDWAPPTSLRWLAIHSGSKPSTKKSANPDTYSIEYIERMMEDIADLTGPKPPTLDEMAFGAIIGVAEVIGYHSRGQMPSHLRFNKRTETMPDPEASPWRSDTEFAILFGRVATLETPIPHKGTQKLWVVPPEHLVVLREAARRAVA